MDTISVRPSRLEQLHHYIKTDTNTLVILIKGERRYLEMLRDILRAHYRVHISPIWPEQYRGFDFGIYINGIKRSLIPQIDAIHHLFKRYLFLDDNLEQTFALDYHMQPQGGRTKIGELVYYAKYKDGAVDTLVEEFLSFIKTHPLYCNADYIYGIPSSSAMLVSKIVEKVCDSLGKKTAPIHITKDKSISMKNLSLEEKLCLAPEAFKTVHIDKAALNGKRIIIIDDIYQSGATMNEIAYRLQIHGAITYGLVATKTHSSANV